jgi:hypothetical protein
MTKPVILEDMAGIGKEEEPDNSNKNMPELKEGKEWKLKYDTHVEVIDLLSSTRYEDVEAIRYKFFKLLKAAPDDVRMKFINLTSKYANEICPKKDWVLLKNMLEQELNREIK